MCYIPKSEAAWGCERKGGRRLFFNSKGVKISHQIGLLEQHNPEIIGILYKNTMSYRVYIDKKKCLT